jgi:hypothetical protein
VAPDLRLDTGVGRAAPDHAVHVSLAHLAFSEPARLPLGRLHGASDTALASLQHTHITNIRRLIQLLPCEHFSSSKERMNKCNLGSSLQKVVI